jgi:hypothetical protein
MSEKVKVVLDVEVHDTGAVSCDGVRYGPSTGVARFFSMMVSDRNRMGRIADRIAGDGVVYLVVERRMSGGLKSTRYHSEQALEDGVRQMGGKRTGTSDGRRLRPELLGHPTFSNLVGPMWGGNGMVRYETDDAYDILSR